MMEGHRVKLTEVNPYLVCVLCHGYLVDATTIAECLHSFCRSCIFRQLSRKSICPICETQVHNTKLYKSLRPDKTLQDIVYKLVPGLFHNEMKRRREFYKNHPFRDEHLEPECRGVGLDRLIYSPDDQISLSLEFYDDEREKEEWSNHGSPKPAQIAPSGPKRYLQCPAGFKMLHLKKFLRQKYGLSPSCNVDIMYRRECLPDSYSLMDVAYIYTWKRNSPMRFYYRMPDVIMKQLMAPPPEIPLNEISVKKDEITEEPIKKNSQEISELDKTKKKEGNETENQDKSAISNSTKSEVHKNIEKQEEAKPNKDQASSDQNGARPVPKQDELPVSVLLSLGQCRVDSNDDHKFLVPQGVPPKNGITEKKNSKISLKLSVNKIASELADSKSQPQQNNENVRANSQVPITQQQQLPQKTKHLPLQKQSYYQKHKHIQPKQPQTISQKQQMQLLKQQQLQHKQQQLLQQKQQIQQIIQQQQELQLQIQQQQQQIQQQQQLKLQQQQQKLLLQQQQQLQLQQQKSIQLQPTQAIILSAQPQNISPHQSPNPHIPQFTYDVQTKQLIQSIPQAIHQQTLHNLTQQPKAPENSQLHSQILQERQNQQNINIINQGCNSPRSNQQLNQGCNSPRSNQQLNQGCNSPRSNQQLNPLQPQQKLDQSQIAKPSDEVSKLPVQNNQLTSGQQPLTIDQKSSTSSQGQSITPPPQIQNIKTPPLRNTPPPQHSTPPPRTTPPPQVQKNTETVSSSELQTASSPQPSTITQQACNKSDSTDQKPSVMEHVQSSLVHLCGSNVNLNPMLTQQNPHLSFQSSLQHQHQIPQNQHQIPQQQQPTPQQQQTQVVQQNQLNQPQQTQIPQQQKPWQDSPRAEPTMNGPPKVQSPQVTLNTSNGSVTIMAQPKNLQNAASPAPNSPEPTLNGKPPDTPRPQGIHQNLPRTVLPKSPFVNGKPQQKSIPQKNISGQRLNNNLPDAKNGIIQQSNINNRLPTFQKSGGGARKSGIPGGVLSKTGPTLDQRIQQLYNSGQTNKPPSPNGGKSESRLASWLNNRFKPQSPKEEPEATTPPAAKDVNMIRYKRKFQELQKGQEMCEITQENPKPDDAKRRREVMPDVSIELMRAADIKKLEGTGTKKEKRPVPGLKSIQEVGAKRKKEEDSVLDLSSAKPGEVLRPQLPWLVNRPPPFIPRQT